MKYDFLEMTLRAQQWLATATPEELWDVLNNGGLDAKAGFPGALPEFGDVAGPGPYGESVATRDWAQDATGDLATWFLGNAAAHEEVRGELMGEATEVAFDLGGQTFEWPRKTVDPDR